MKQADQVANALIEHISKHPNKYEVKVTQDVAHTLKRKKTGLFQNEVDYKVLFPKYVPYKGTKSRVDLVGYTPNGFVFCELKIRNESKTTKNHWGVMYEFWMDLVKLETAIKKNNLRHRGAALFVIGVRQPKALNRTQAKVMAKIWGGSKQYKPLPPNPDGNYYSVLEAFRVFVMENHPSWKLRTVKRKNVVFLVGKRNLDAKK